MKSPNKQKPILSNDELAQGLNTFLEKNRESLSIEELELITIVYNFIILNRKSKSKIKEFLLDWIPALLKIILNSNVLEIISKFL